MQVKAGILESTLKVSPLDKRESLKHRYSEWWCSKGSGELINAAIVNGGVPKVLESLETQL